MKSFDLTTEKGIKNSLDFLGNDYLQRYMAFAFPVPFLVLKGVKFLMDKFVSSPNEMGKVVEDLIRKGKEVGVDEMEIMFKDNGGVNFNAPIDEDVKIDFHLGKDQKTKIRVKYK